MTDEREPRAALQRALTAIEPAIADIARSVRDASPDRDGPEYDDREREQFLHAFVLLIKEDLEGRTDEKRRLVLDTAVPAMVAHGQTVPGFVERLTGFFTVFGHRLLSATPADHRDAASLWLARFFSVLLRDVVETAQRETEAR